MTTSTLQVVSVVRTGLGAALGLLGAVTRATGQVLAVATSAAADAVDVAAARVRPASVPTRSAHPTGGLHPEPNTTVSRRRRGSDGPSRPRTSRRRQTASERTSQA